MDEMTPCKVKDIVYSDHPSRQLSPNYAVPPYVENSCSLAAIFHKKISDGPTVHHLPSKRQQLTKLVTLLYYCLSDCTFHLS